MKKEEFFDNNPHIEEDADLDVLETGPEMQIEEINHKETIDNIGRKINAVRHKIEAAEEALNTLKEAYIEAKAEEKASIRSMAVSADWALHRAEQELAETLEALGVTDPD